MKIGIRKVIFFGLLILINACFSAGNIGQIKYVPHNLSFDCINLYLDNMAGLYQVPEELSFYKLDYDHIKVYNYYFDDSPKAIYRLRY